MTFQELATGVGIFVILLFATLCLWALVWAVCRVISDARLPAGVRPHAHTDAPEMGDLKRRIESLARDLHDHKFPAQGFFPSAMSMEHVQRLVHAPNLDQSVANELSAMSSAREFLKKKS